MTDGMEAVFPLIFARGAYLELLDFPQPIIKAAGYELHKVQHGRKPTDSKPIVGLVGAISGVFEIRLSHEGNEYRVIYVPGLARSVYVLHCFQKKRRSTPRQALALTTQRYKEILHLIHA